MTQELSWTRRSVLRSSLASGLFAALPAARSPLDVQAAFLLAFPLFEFARSGWALAGRSPERPAGRYNTYIHRRTLTDPSQRIITATNNDCLVSTARLDLSSGPLVLAVPTITDRYFSIALMDAFTDNFRFVGTRATRGAGGTFVLAPKHWRGSVPPGTVRIDAPSTDVWLLARILVDGPQDYPRVNALQDALAVRPLLGAGQPGMLPLIPRDERDPENLLGVASAMLARIPVDDARVARAMRQAGLGLVRGWPEAFTHLPASLRREWHDALPGMLETLARPRVGAVRKSGGWSYSNGAIGTYGSDDFLRAQTALIGLAALPPEEAFYGQALADSAGGDLEAAGAYRLRIPAGGPPARAFWSLTMYQVESDGRLFLTPNPIRRYSIGDRTKGLVFNRDGTLDILMQRETPAGSGAANWLPTPASGRFRPTFRAYLAKPELLSLKWKLPAIERVA